MKINKLNNHVREALFSKNKSAYEGKWGKWVPHVYRDKDRAPPVNLFPLRKPMDAPLNFTPIDERVLGGQLTTKANGTTGRVGRYRWDSLFSNSNELRVSQ